MKVIICSWLLLFLLGTQFIEAQQEIEINDNVDLRGKIEQVDIIERGDGCIDVQLRYIGDCADRLDLYIDGTYSKSIYVPEGSKINEPYIFTITALKGCEEILVYVHFIDCKEPEPIVQDTVYIKSSFDPCEPCIASCDTNSLYVFNFTEHNGWYKKTSIPMNRAQFGIGVRTDFGSDSLFVFRFEFSPMTNNWVRYFLDYYEHYTTADIVSYVDFGFSSVRLFASYQFAFHYENSNMDRMQYDGGLRFKLWKLRGEVGQTYTRLINQYPFRPTNGVFYTTYSRLGFSIFEDNTHRMELGGIYNISKYSDDWYEVLHEPLYPGVYLEYGLCYQPINLYALVSWEKTNQKELYKVQNLYIDPPENMFQITISLRYNIFN